MTKRRDPVDRRDGHADWPVPCTSSRQSAVPANVGATSPPSIERLLSLPRPRSKSRAQPHASKPEARFSHRPALLCVSVCAFTWRILTALCYRPWHLAAQCRPGFQACQHSVIHALTCAGSLTHALNPPPLAGLSVPGLPCHALSCPALPVRTKKEKSKKNRRIACLFLCDGRL